MSRKKQQDILARKRAEAEMYTRRYDNTVTFVSRAVDDLVEYNDGITKAMQEIDQYQEDLEKTKEEFAKQKDANERTIRNFKALIGME
jgi:FtsZ-binding cell division protein ZapB